MVYIGEILLKSVPFSQCEVSSTSIQVFTRYICVFKQTIINIECNLIYTFIKKKL